MASSVCGQVLFARVRERIDNETFFAAPDAARPAQSVSEGTFFAGRERPPVDTPLAVRAAATPMRFALILFLVGWAGILFQASFLQQVVFGAPVFEEAAKLGPPLILVILLGVRSNWIRLPLAWASGAGFGIMEHYVTYAEEDLGLFIERIAFHTAAPGLSMLMYGAFENYPDVRARWVATIPATLFHWANNFAAVILSYGALFLGVSAESAGLAWGTLMTVAMIVLTLAGILSRARFEYIAQRMLRHAMPRLGLSS